MALNNSLDTLEKKGLTLNRGWERFIAFCQTLGHGEIEKLKVQDGVPMMAETVTKKVKFS